jgi:hypothetical protein
MLIGYEFRSLDQETRAESGMPKVGVAEPLTPEPGVNLSSPARWRISRLCA